MLPNEKFALACRAYYDEQGLIVDRTNGQFAHCPLPRNDCDTGYYLLWEHHQHQGLLQSRDVGRCCFWPGDVKKWLLTANYFPDAYFELWDIYEEFSVKNGLRLAASRTPDDELRRLAGLRKKFKLEKPKNLKFLHSSDVQARATEGKKRFWQSEEGEKRKQKAKQRRMHNAKQVEVTFEDGRVGTYPNAHFAGVALGVSYASVSLWARNKVTPTRSILVRYL